MFATSSIGKGRIKSIDASSAAKTPGVLLVLTHDSMDRLQSPGFTFGGGYGFQNLALMQTDRVFYRGQPIALIVAESLEAAIEGAALLAFEYEEESFSVTLDAAGAETILQSEAIPIPHFADKTIGDAAAAIKGAEVVVGAEYFSRPQHQNPMELLATVAEWHDGMLTVHDLESGNRPLT